MQYMSIKYVYCLQIFNIEIFTHRTLFKFSCELDVISRVWKHFISSLCTFITVNTILDKSVDDKKFNLINKQNFYYQ